MPKIEDEITGIKSEANKLNIAQTHSILQTFLDISPISLMLDIGNKIIDRKGKHVNRGKQPNANKTHLKDTC